MAFDLNDPSSFPADPGEVLDELDRLQEGEPQPAAETAPAVPATGEAVDPAAVTEPPAALAAPTEAAGDGHGGDKLIPVRALAEVRAELRERDQRIADLEARLSPAPPAAPPAVDAWAAERGDLERERAAAEADGDTALVAVLRAQIAGGDRMNARLAELEQVIQRQQAAVAAGDEALRQAAYEASPLLQAWAQDEARPLWHRTAVTLHGDLMQRDPAYAAATWPERFARLPGLVEGQLGVSAPHRMAALAAPPAAKGTTAAPAPAPVVPRSISEIPGGTASAAPDPRTPEEFGQLPPAERSEALLRMSRDPRKLWDFLDSLPDAAFGQSSA